MMGAALYAVAQKQKSSKLGGISVVFRKAMGVEMGTDYHLLMMIGFMREDCSGEIGEPSLLWESPRHPS